MISALIILGLGVFLVTALAVCDGESDEEDDFYE